MTEQNPLGPPQSTYYIGDWPVPQIPYSPPYVPYTPPILPGVGTTTNKLFTESENKMDVYIIWAITPDFPEKPWAVAVFDADARDEDDSDFEEALADAEESYGARFVRVTKTSVNYDAVIQAFAPADV